MVSIVTVYYNRENYVVDSIESLLKQTYSDIEVIAIDDGSTDGTLVRLRSIQDPRLRVITHSNRGFVQSIRSAIMQTSSEIVAIHGSGDISSETRIERQLELLQSHPDIGVVGCYVENYFENTGTSFINKPVIDESISLTKQIIKENPFTHGEVMFRKKVYEQAGGYREFFKFCQDYDLWLRMSMLTSFAIVPEVLYRRYFLSDGVSASLDKMLMQKYFDEMGIQCIELRMRNEPDFIDRYGIYGAFYRARTRRLSKIIGRHAMTALYRGKTSEALYFNRKSMEEKLGLSNACLHLFLFLLNRSKLLQRMTAKGLSIVKARRSGAGKPLASEQQEGTLEHM
ncbi:hypothetical protein PAECIP111893_03344 [Paenibacillus plantiphilus]|uniref:Glycosyltransferase 2-like domain-containing protein n=1 Tax=Paenibacillus plantiphilus TaxID=2905650 RepID=A0ABN8GT13_9BACL|nr:glycosyltransferase [Paenibacillus plantiphilus]CAH1210984.1 hypothetical protein PAECIP111893_03344 [Paenibacillus plantiphilus]